MQEHSQKQANVESHDEIRPTMTQANPARRKYPPNVLTNRALCCTFRYRHAHSIACANTRFRSLMLSHANI
jgi:hypothetical protein